MMRLGKVTLVLFAVVVLATTGCGGSKADKAAQDLLNIMKDADKFKENPAKAMEMLPKMMQAAATMAEEMEKMSDAEKKAFEKKWREKFEKAGQKFGGM